MKDYKKILEDAIVVIMKSRKNSNIIPLYRMVDADVKLKLKENNITELDKTNIIVLNTVSKAVKDIYTTSKLSNKPVPEKESTFINSLVENDLIIINDLAKANVIIASAFKENNIDCSNKKDLGRAMKLANSNIELAKVFSEDRNTIIRSLF